MRAFHPLFSRQWMLAAAGLVAVAAVIGVRSAHAEPRAEPFKVQAGSDDRLRPRGWSVHLDNDLFAFTDDDRDYTAGISVTLGGKDSAGPERMAQALEWLDLKSGFGPHARASSAAPERIAGDGATTRFGQEGAGDGETIRSFAAGILLFTPQDLESEAPLYDDRPYANLAYLSTSRLTHNRSSRIAYQSSLTVGVLGMPWVEHLHRGVHRALGSQEPMGYEHQISDGGEPTARYAVSRYRLLDSGTFRKRPYHLRLGLSGSIGYLTEASADLAFRWGNLNTPWWSSSPSIADYGGHPPIRLAGRAEGSGPRFQVAAGVNVRLRAYNAFLQGQFRSSDVTYSASRLNQVLLEAWLGLTTVFPNDVSVTYTVRHQTEELRTGNGAREFTWASIGIAQQF